MNGTPTRRAVCYALLIVCLAAAILTLFLPFMYYGKEAEPTTPFVALRYLTLSRENLREQSKQFTSYGADSLVSYYSDSVISYYNEQSFALFSTLGILGACFTGLFLGLGLRRVLKGLNRERRGSQRLELGAGPVIGAVFCGLLVLYALGYNLLDEYDPCHLTAWPFFGILINLCAMRLARVLNEDSPTEPDPGL